MVQVALQDIENTVQAALVAHGAETFPAAEVARATARSEATGNRICGLYYLKSYCDQLVSGRVRGDAVPAVSTPRPATIVVDAGYGFAQPAFAYGLAPALDAARRYGVASLAVTHAHTCTALGYFTEQIALSGCIGLGFANASPIVAPPGGQTRVIGTNPMAFSVPDGQGGLAMQFDQSTTTVALGAITRAKAAGQTIPQNWAVDAMGAPTTDPEEALKGSLTSLGGAKGWGLGVMVELLAAGMTGGVLSRDVAPLKAPEGAPHDLGQYYILIDPSSSGAFSARLHCLLEAVAQDDGARLPGQYRCPADPVDLEEAAWAEACNLAQRPAK